VAGFDMQPWGCAANVTYATYGTNEADS
jgi:hypothetical protein